MTAAAEPLTSATSPTSATSASSDPPSSRREERLLRLLERASASSRFNLGERWLFALGGALVVAGFVVVLIGWAGASRTVLVAGQIPYLLSGGLIGLGLIFLGGFLYFGHWVAVLVRESRERGVEDREDLARVRSGLDEVNRGLMAVAAALGAAAVAGRPEHSAVPARRSPGPITAVASRMGTDDTAPVLLATPTGTMAHRPGCRALTAKTDLRPVSATDGLKPCGMCRPLDDPALQ